MLLNRLLNTVLLFNIPGGTGSGGSKEGMSRDALRSALDSADNNEADDSADDADADLESDNLELEDDTNDKDADLDDAADDKDAESEDEDADSDDKDELAELEEDLKEPTDEDLELTVPVKKREILAKYPNLFRDFPALEKSYYRELEYTRILPTIKDAKEAAQAVNILNAFEEDLKEGNTQNIFKAIHKDDPNAFAKLADSYIDNLAAVDERAYHHVLGNVTKDIVQAMVKNASKTKNKDLQDAASLLYQFMFGDVDWQPKQKLAIPENTSENEGKKALDRERQEFENSKLTGYKTDVTTSSNNRIKSVVDANIDKRNAMSGYVKTKATEDVMNKVESMIKADSRFQQVLDRLWERARGAKYSKDSLNTIESAIVSKAKSLLPAVINSVKKSALKASTNTKPRNKSKESDDSDEQSNQNTRRDSTPRNRVDSNDRNKPLPGEATIDFINRTSRR